MKMKPVLKKVLLLAFSLPGISMAADTALYATVDVGHSSFSLQRDPPLTAQQLAAKVDTLESSNNSAFALHVGYQFNASLALEGGYNEFGKLEFVEQRPFPLGAPGIHGKLSTSSIDLSLVGTLPVSSRFAAYGKIGMAHTTTHFYLGDYNNADSKMAAKWGAGMSWAWNDAVSTHVEWSHHAGLRSNAGKASVNLLTVGMGYKF